MFAFNTAQIPIEISRTTTSIDVPFCQTHPFEIPQDRLQTLLTVDTTQPQFAKPQIDTLDAAHQSSVIMPESVERGESPPPERSSGKQMHDPPASGKGVDDASHQEAMNKDALEVWKCGPSIRNEYRTDSRCTEARVQPERTAGG